MTPSRRSRTASRSGLRPRARPRSRVAHATGATALVLAVAASLASAPAHAGALGDAVRAAFAHDPLYAAALAGARGGQAREAQARALWRPQASAAIGGGVGGARNAMTGASFSAPGFPDTTGAAFRTSIDAGPYLRWVLTAQQPLVSRERSASQRQLEAQARIDATRLALAEQDLRLRVVQAWFEVRAAEDAVALIERQREAVERALAEARERYDEGDAPITEWRDAQARRDDVTAQRIAAQSELRVRRAVLEDITGRPTTPDATPAERAAPGTVADPGALEPWLARASTDSPMQRLLALAETVAREDVARWAGWTSPTVDLVARASDERLRGDGAWGDARITSSAYSIGVQVTVPLATGGMRDAQRAEAIAALERVQAEQADGLRMVQRQVRAAWEGVTAGAARVQALEQALRSAQTRLDATQTGREAGARTTLDVLNAQAERYAAERMLLQARYALRVDRARLAAAAGELDDALVDQLDLGSRP